MTKIAARTMAEIDAIANMTVVDSFGTSGPAGGGARVGSMGSALDRFAALRAELHVARDLVAVRAPQELGRAAFPAELQAGRDGLAALHARLAARGHGRVGPQFPQNFVVTGFIVPHFGHALCWGCCWAIMP